MIAGILTSATPLLLAGLGALLTEFSGALGIFIEGFMVLGSFFAFVLAVNLGSVWWGTLLTALLGAVTGWALARFIHKTRANPFIAGLALNLAAGGVTDSLSRIWFGTKGVLRAPELSIPGPVFIPLIEKLPGVGKILSGQLPFTYAAWVLVILGGLFIGKTPLGLRLRAAGRSPLAAEERGLHPAWYREGAWAAAAFLACLAGAALSFRVGAYTPGGVAGRGWIALAAIYLGFRTVRGTAVAALVFALAEYVGFGLQGFDAVPATVLLGLPSGLALLLYTLSHVAAGGSVAHGRRRG
ncbi:MAG: ABC transporter permease [Spirochaetaceae bacterium]|jgi:simple sugar transport system permease protein|nr:ABC transporter permease [Spirochaetaceae bacterium]